ncbi:MAG: helix-turn-helix transcriptional regulator [candidate division Zixibacteria bacterium]|nr:helix-turn-helix transcriptional regulator [candidate division Zixibacteria bacterium]
MTGNKIKELRKLHGLSLERLADMTGLTKGYLSKIERSETPPPFSTLQKLSEALDVDVNELLESQGTSRPSRNIDFIQAASKKAVPFKIEGNCSFKPLLKSYRNKQMSPFLMIIAPGKTKIFTHDAEEFVYVLSGKVELHYDKEKYDFSQGDCFYLDSRIGHKFVNNEKKDAQLLAVDFNYRRFL